MPVMRAALSLLLLTLPISANADVRPDDLPADTVWYLHADLGQMRSSDSGGQLYDWLDGEVMVEVTDEIGFDLNKEVDKITAFSASDNGTVILVEGNISKDTQQIVLDKADDEGKLEEYEHKGRAYFHSYGHRDGDEDEDNEPLADLKDGGYFSFALKNRLLVTANENQMLELLDNNGKVAGTLTNPDALFVLTADKSFVQAGLKTDDYHDDDDDWDSNIIRNTDSAALMISDFGGNIALELQLVATDATVSQSLGGIVNGLLALQAFNSELDPTIQTLIANTKIDVDDKILSINTVIAPELIISALDND